MRDITLGELIEWILKNRTSKVFVNYTKEAILREIIHSINHNTLTYVTDASDLIGVTTGVVDKSSKVCHVTNCIAKTTKALKDMLAWFQNNYPNYTLQAERNNGRKFMKYNPTILQRRLK